MKTRIFILFLIAVMTFSLSACHLAAAEDRLDAVEDRIENRVDRVEDAIEDSIEQALSPSSAAVATEPPVPLAPAPETATGETAPQETAAPVNPTAALTPEEAEAIALEHAGFTADQVKFLRTVYDWDDGVPEYEVSFHVDRWEYEYDIDAETGAIRSYDRDD